MFFAELAKFKNSTAVIDGDFRLSYQQLAEKCDEFAQQVLAQYPEKTLVLLKAQNDHLSLVAYLSCLRLAYPLMLVDPDINPEQLANLQKTYQAGCVIEKLNIHTLDGDGDGDGDKGQFADELALLLSTSGSTGSAKQVCLSANNLQANAESICEYLPILATDKTITTLPFFYSYGLSVINSHLLVGACIVFSRSSVVSREFWQVFKQQEISSLAGVPYTYEMLLRLRFERMDLPSLRYFTQAGGKLKKQLVLRLAEYAAQSNKPFFVMYGQTEATARMAYLNSETVQTKPDSIGQAIPYGKLSLLDEQGKVITVSNQVGELVFQGPNIMLGYAESAQDLLVFKKITSLATGDLAYCDQEGDYFIQGRIKRFIKLFGQRLNLDEVEQLLAQKKLESYCTGDDTKLIVAIENCSNIKQLTTDISQALKLHRSVIKVFSVAELPLNANGKKDYQQVLEWATEQ